jgi:hypothetical protein
MMVIRKLLEPGDHQLTLLLSRLLAAFAVMVMFACFAMAIAALALVEAGTAQSKLNPVTPAGEAVVAEVNLPGPQAPGAQTAPNAALPMNVVLPSIGVSSELSDLRLQSDGSLEAPKDFSMAGWWIEGTRPGDPGPAIVVGHVDSFRGPAVFHKLGLLKLGSQILIGRKDGSTVVFAVTDVGQYPKDKFPTQLVYGSTPGPSLRLITCGGSFDKRKRSYQDNVVVFARQVSPAVTLSAEASN